MDCRQLEPNLHSVIDGHHRTPHWAEEQQRSSNARVRSGERSLRHALRCRHLADIEDAGWAQAILEKEFKVPEEARIIGVVDLEIRSLAGPERPLVRRGMTKRWRPNPLSPEPSRLAPLLRRARLEMGLSFRAAADMSREVADMLGGTSRHQDRYPITRRSTLQRVTSTRL